MILRMFGIGCNAAVAGGQTQGTVTRVKTCYWLKVNTKPVRKGAVDGALFPHIIHTGKRYANWNKRCPVKDESSLFIMKRMRRKNTRSSYKRRTI